MKALLNSGSRRSLHWPLLAALLLLSLSAAARDGHGGWGHHGGGRADGHFAHGGARADGHFAHGGARHHGTFHRGGRAFFGFGFGPSWYEPYGYGYPVGYGYPIGYGYPPPGYVYAPGYAYPPAYAVPPAYAYPPAYAAPPLYPQQADPSQYGYRDYCSETNAYYPSVLQCPGGWQRVPLQPSVR